jgi:hypothetical protein
VKIYIPQLSYIRLRLECISRSNEIAVVVLPTWDSQSWWTLLQQLVWRGNGQQQVQAMMELGAAKQVIVDAEQAWPNQWRMNAWIVSSTNKKSKKDE